MFFLLVRRLIMISTPGHFILLIHFVLEVLPVDIMFPGHFYLLLIMGFSKIYTSLRYAHVKTKIYIYCTSFGFLGNLDIIFFCSVGCFPFERFGWESLIHSR